MKHKPCSKCGEIKPLTEFGRHNQHLDGLQSKCKPCINEWHRKHSQQPAIKASRNKRLCKKRQLVRTRLLELYGTRCSLCCRPNLLEIDHVNNDGAQHRKECPHGKAYAAILAEGFRPDKYRTLCAPCNQLARWFSDEQIRVMMDALSKIPAQ